MKKLLTSLAAVTLSLVLCVPAYARNYTGSGDWLVTFTSGKEMTSNFTSSEWHDTMAGMQPGDTADFQVTIQNSYPGETYWYMTNEVLKSLEDASENALTQGGGYSYVLTYTGNDGLVTIFDSDTVGGENVSPAGEGLHEATDATEEYFKIDTLKAGQKGVVNLHVELDGETQNNDYQDTLAQLNVQFATELPGTDRKTVKTGDESSPWMFILMAAAAVVLFVIAVIRVIQNRRYDRANKNR